MAGSRLDKIGTIFSRMTGLLKTGAIKYQDRPIWYDVYRIFPPKYEPMYDRKPENDSQVPTILYKEDKLRAEFFKTFGLNPGGELRNLSDSSFQENSQTFLKKCTEIEKLNPSWTLEKVFEVATRDMNLNETQTQSIKRFSNVSAEEALTEVNAQDETLIDKRKTRKSIVTAESLLTLFKEAKDEEQNKTNNKE